jgi:hypothetical protein
MTQRVVTQVLEFIQGSGEGQKQADKTEQAQPLGLTAGYCITRHY